MPVPDRLARGWRSACAASGTSCILRYSLQVCAIQSEDYSCRSGHQTLIKSMMSSKIIQRLLAYSFDARQSHLRAIARAACALLERHAHRQTLSSAPLSHLTDDGALLYQILSPGVGRWRFMRDCTAADQAAKSKFPSCLQEKAAAIRNSV